MKTKMLTLTLPRLLGFIVLAICILALILVMFGQSQALLSSVGWHDLASIGWNG